jgi:hypothetical protein
MNCKTLYVPDDGGPLKRLGSLINALLLVCSVGILYCYTLVHGHSVLQNCATQCSFQSVGRKSCWSAVTRQVLKCTMEEEENPVK